jgi:Flp pilus assembly protein TadD
VVQVPAETAIVTRPSAANVPIAAAPPTQASGPAAAPVAAPPANPPAKPGLWSRWFGSARPENSGQSSYAASGVTPLPGTTPMASVAPAPTESPKPKPIKIIPPTPVYFPRYHYFYPRPPAAGDRAAASRAFAQARQAEQSENWSAALAGYRSAASQDPAWFEAQYNAGVLAQRLGNYSQALASYETALALQPDSVNARYNFALTLKAAGYVPDAAEELKKILADNPREVRAHLALANLCAQQLHDPAQAREHYLKVLELAPRSAEAANIRFWLAANPVN